ncbi:hypothetical protein GALMADRAFT_145571 [Galerina marginata CBS 339.88]|uniref:Uncharacterized protein n=1 Tax=Galerina marginata (strain CBS 339.88) TaxID=685588 RepID=A0A067SE28_GALM3|nr:hypothetical protein GALMADRAFT_145571 [Galerina marginata CBS 339.88]
MPATRSLNALLGMLLLLTPLALSQGGVGPFHPYPGALAQDCLQLIGENLNKDSPLAYSSGLATIELCLCSITTKCAAGETELVRDDVVRRALTSIGGCALNYLWSISGSYTAKNGAKTCYLYPGNLDYSVKTNAIRQLVSWTSRIFATPKLYLLDPHF